MALILKVWLATTCVIAYIQWFNNYHINAKQNDDNLQPIHDAAMCGHAAVVANLISKHGVDPKCSGKVSFVIFVMPMNMPTLGSTMQIILIGWYASNSPCCNCWSSGSYDYTNTAL